MAIRTTAAAGAAGGALCIGLMEYGSVRTVYPLMTVPLATSIALVTGAREASPAQSPRGTHALAPALTVGSLHCRRANGRIFTGDA